jgi:hypothetical protein
MKIFEVEKEGLEGEPARARVFLKLAGIYWVVAFICFSLWSFTESKTAQNEIIGTFGLFGLLGAIFSTARALFHLLTVSIVNLPERHRFAAQVIVIFASPILPLLYFFSNADLLPYPPVEELVGYVTSWAVWLMTIIFGYVWYLAGFTIKPLVPFRSYLIAVATVFVVVVVGTYGGFSGGTDEYDYGYNSSSPLDPKSTSGGFWMAVNYVRLLAASYLGLFVGELRRGRIF